MTTLFLVVWAVLGANGADGAEDQLKFLAATQEQTQVAYSRLSYDANVINTSFIPNLKSSLPVTSRYVVRVHGDTVLNTWECLTTLKEDEGNDGKPSITVSDQPRVKRVLKTPTYIAVWRDVANPTIMLYYLEDWRDSLRDYNTTFDSTFSLVDINRLCFGHSTPFVSLYRNQGFSARWDVLAFEAGERIQVQRSLPVKEAVYSPDLMLDMNPMDGLVRNGTFKPVAAKLGAEVNVEYVEASIGGRSLHVPSTYNYDKASEREELKSNIAITFTNFVDEADKPELTLSDLGVPVGAALRKMYPDGRQKTAKWDGLQLTFH
tara:strand:- start:1311 stop:2270 length:960 start_codon:yes stop_codon:yes gene_type:complete